MDDIIGLLERICVIARNKNNQGNRDEEASRKSARTIMAKLVEGFSIFTRSRNVASDRASPPLSKGLVLPHWAGLHTAFVDLDVCRFTLATLDYLLSREDFMTLVGPDLLRDQVTHLKENVGKLCTATRQHAVELRKRLQEPDAIQKLVQMILGHPTNLNDPVGKELRNLVDEPWLGEIADKFLTSSIEALNGISDIKVF